MLSTIGVSNNGGTVSPALLNLLANYYLVRLKYKQIKEKRAVAECNMSETAGQAFFEYLKARHGLADAQSVDASMGFELGLEVAAAIINAGLDASQATKQIATALSVVDSLFEVPAA